MNSNLSINVNPEELAEKGNEILTQYKLIEEAIKEIQEATNGLSSWVSANKDRYDARIKAAIPKMQEMAEVIASYGNVANITSRAIINTENIIAKNIEMNG